MTTDSPSHSKPILGQIQFHVLTHLGQEKMATTLADDTFKHISLNWIFLIYI